MASERKNGGESYHYDDEIPPPSPERRDTLTDAWREVLGEILAEEQAKWAREQARMRAEADAIIAHLRSEVAIARAQIEQLITQRLSTVRDGEVGPPGPKGESGPPGRDGRLPNVTEWSGSVHYEGDLVHHGGSLWQCIRDTGHPPPHPDWGCIARAGRDGRTPIICGTWSSEADYRAYDVVACGGASFIALRDAPGVCPGDGWQAIALPGKRGRQGEPGPRGEKGERGPPGPAIIKWEVNREAYTALPIMSDGTSGPLLELRGLFEQFYHEAG